MLKSVAIATLLLAVTGWSIVHAQQRTEQQGGSGGFGGSRFERHYRPNVDDIKAFTDARIAALRAGLALTPDQDKNWPPFEQALRDLANLHIQRMQERETGREQEQLTNPFERLQRRADAMSQLSAALKHVADTGSPLFQSLSDPQKNPIQIPRSYFAARLEGRRRLLARNS